MKCRERDLACALIRLLSSCLFVLHFSFLRREEDREAQTLQFGRGQALDNNEKVSHLKLKPSCKHTRSAPHTTTAQQLVHAERRTQNAAQRAQRTQRTQHTMHTMHTIHAMTRNDTQTRRITHALANTTQANPCNNTT
jgi:hypothetical protein